jgi:pimeloyl-[acyl-carrier protein] synthase
MKTTTPQFDDLIVTPEFIAHPFPLLHRMREEDPVYWSDAIGGWVLTGYDDIMVSFKSTSHFSNENRLGKAMAYLTPEKQDKYKPFADHYATKSLLHSDPPDHTRMKALITREFNAKVVEQMKPKIQETVDSLIDKVLARGSMDIVSELASPLPISVIAQILGVPHSDHHLFKIWADDLLAFQGVNKPSENDLDRAQKAIVHMRPYIREMIEARKIKPQDDLISKFAEEEGKAGRISETELISTTVTLFVAGQETTISLIANTIYTLLSHPDQLALLRQNPDLLASTIEESLRYESPITRQPRLMKEDIELHGKHLKKGQMAFQMLNAANRDPAYFTDPDKFDIKRENNKHLAFGYGIHFCVGAVLARVEGAIAIGTAIKRLPNLRLVDPNPHWDIEKRNSRVLHNLQVEF